MDEWKKYNDNIKNAKIGYYKKYKKDFINEFNSDDFLAGLLTLLLVVFLLGVITFL